VRTGKRSEPGDDAAPAELAGSAGQDRPGQQPRRYAGEGQAAGHREGDELFLLVLGQKPTAEQLKVATDHITKFEKDKKTAYENILWALINSKAFIFNR